MASHLFEARPNRALLALALPALFSLVAEPLTGLADTAFVARLGAEPLAGLGVGTTLLSSVFWVFNFLGVGSQTEVAQALGRGDNAGAARMAGLAMMTSVACGCGLVLLAWPLLPLLCGLMGAQGSVRDAAETYMFWRLLGGPGVLLGLACFGALRGLQDMRTPMWVATGLNVLNVGLDWLLIFGWGPVPALGVAGAAMATSVSQWLGAIIAAAVVVRRLGWPRAVLAADARRLFVVGRDLFIRTGMLTLFLILTTRAATLAGPAPAAAHQAIRMSFIFTALFLDCFALSGQSLVGYFLGRRDVGQARRAAKLVCWWSFATGCAIGGCMLLLRKPVAGLLVPAGAWAVFFPAWGVAAAMLPVNSFSFATDGINWGAGDFVYLRNAMVISSVLGAAALFAVRAMSPAEPLVWIWLTTGLWSACRGGLGFARVWPGVGRGAPLGRG